MIKSNNEWVPEVGDVVEVASDDRSNSGSSVKITYLGNGVGCYRRIDNGREYTFHTAQTKFRQIKTEAEKRRDEMVDALESFLRSNERTQYRAMAEDLIDAGWIKPKPLTEGVFESIWAQINEQSVYTSHFERSKRFAKAIEAYICGEAP